MLHEVFLDFFASYSAPRVIILLEKFFKCYKSLSIMKTSSQQNELPKIKRP